MGKDCISSPKWYFNYCSDIAENGMESKFSYSAVKNFDSGLRWQEDRNFIFSCLTADPSRLWCACHRRTTKIIFSVSAVAWNGLHFCWIAETRIFCISAVTIACCILFSVGWKKNFDCLLPNGLYTFFFWCFCQRNFLNHDCTVSATAGMWLLLCLMVVFPIIGCLLIQEHGISVVPTMCKEYHIMVFYCNEILCTFLCSLELLPKFSYLMISESLTDEYYYLGKTKRI